MNFWMRAKKRQSAAGRLCDANGDCESDVVGIEREGDSRWELIKQRESIDLTAGLERRLRLPVRESRGWIQRSSRAKKLAAIVVWERQAVLAQNGPCSLSLLAVVTGSRVRYLSRQCVLHFSFINPLFPSPPVGRIPVTLRLFSAGCDCYSMSGSGLTTIRHL